MNMETVRRVVAPILVSVAAVLVGLAALVVIVDSARGDGAADTAAVAVTDGAATIEGADAADADAGASGDPGASAADAGDGDRQADGGDGYEDGYGNGDDGYEDGDDWYAGGEDGPLPDIAEFLGELLGEGGLGQLLQWLIGAIFGGGGGFFGGDGFGGGFAPFGGFGGAGEDAGALGPPLIGVGVEETADGLRVTSVVPGLGADEAGIEEGDVIVAVGGEAIGDVAQLRALLAGAEPDDEVDVRIERDGSERSLSVTLAPGVTLAPEGGDPRFGFRAGGTPGGDFAFGGDLDELADLLESGELEELLERNPDLRALFGDGPFGENEFGGLLEWLRRLFEASEGGGEPSAPSGAYGSSGA